MSSNQQKRSRKVWHFYQERHDVRHLNVCSSIFSSRRAPLSPPSSLFIEEFALLGRDTAV
jgi:hypothetical protein